MNLVINWERAVASWYGGNFNGKVMANGSIFDSKELTVASREYEFGARLLLNHGDNTVIGIVSDRGPWIAARDLDVSEQIALKLGIREIGVAPVNVLLLEN